MPFSSDVNTEIANDVLEEYRQAAFWLPYSAVEINRVFDDDELDDLGTFVAEMNDAAATNEDRAASIEKYSQLALKLLKLAKVVV